MEYNPGRFVWFELLTPEVDRAKAFYAEALNWKIEPMDSIPGMHYDLIKVGDAGIGGIMKPPMAGIPSHWLSYVSVEDVGATARKVADAGGKALADAMDIPSVGRIQPVQDPQGGVLALFRAADGDPPAVEGTGSFAWNELWTSDDGAALAFYEKVFGYTHEGWGPDGAYKILKSADQPRGGLMKSPVEGVPTMWLPYVTVDSADDTVARVKRLGGEVHKDPEDMPEVGRIAILKDPVGAVLGLLQPAKR